MSATLVLVNLAGYVALMLWGMHMVQSGIMRAFGTALRNLLPAGIDSRWKAFAAGLGITAVIQSSTATNLMVTSFIITGVMGLVPALAVMLGGNVGTTIIVQLLSFDVSPGATALVLAGFIAYQRGHKTRIRDVGRAAIGLGVILLSLRAISGVIEPVEQAQALRQLLAVMAGDPILNVLTGALLTWAAHSSVAVLLFVMSLAGAHVIPPMAMVTLVLGANLGAIVPQYMAAGRNQVGRRLALANLIVRGTGSLAVLAFLPAVTGAMPLLSPDPAQQVALFHMAFNVILALIFIGLLNRLAWLLERLLPTPPQTNDPAQPQYLTAAALGTPGIALVQAEREVLRIVDVIDAMLKAFHEALRSDDRKKLDEISQLDDTIDQLHNAVKTYLTQISREDGLDEADARRCSELLAFTINLEHAGDILDKSLREIASKKIKYQLSFSDEGFAEITEMHQRVLQQLRVAVSVFMTGDLRFARTLLHEKIVMRDLEKAATGNHLQRLREGKPESIDTSALHLDIVRDLKRITAHLASVVYPVLEPAGALRRSRLVDEMLPPIARSAIRTSEAGSTRC